MNQEKTGRALDVVMHMQMLSCMNRVSKIASKPVLFDTKRNKNAGNGISEKRSVEQYIHNGTWVYSIKRI